MANGKKNVPAKKEAAGVPAYLVSKDGDLGNEGISPNDVRIPRLKITQKSSKYTDKVEIKNGEIYNTLTGKNMGASIEFHVLLMWKSFVWFSEDFKMLGTKYRDIVTNEEVIMGTPGKPDNAKESWNYMVITREDLATCIKNHQLTFPSIFSCISASLSGARQLNSKIQINANQKVPCWAQIVSMTSEAKEYPKGTAWMPVFKFPGFCNETEVKALKALRENCKKLYQQKAVHMEEEEEEAKPAPAKSRPAKNEPQKDFFDEAPPADDDWT